MKNRGRSPAGAKASALRSGTGSSGHSLASDHEHEEAAVGAAAAVGAGDAEAPARGQGSSGIRSDTLRRLLVAPDLVTCWPARPFDREMAPKVGPHALPPGFPAKGRGGPPKGESWPRPSCRCGDRRRGSPCWPTWPGQPTSSQRLGRS